jgi:solute:Na+ symporter, SSS family
VSTIDHVIIALFLIASVASGVYFSKASSTNANSYFLGNNENRWWMLAASGSSSNFSIMGTIWNVSIIIVLGMKSYWTVLLWWMPLAVFLMSYTGIWIRRCGVMTSAELNRARFGEGRGGQWARSTFAVMISIFNIATICMSYIAIHKIAGVFGMPQHQTAMLVVVATGVYVLVGGFKGVIWVDFLQTILLTVVSIIIGVIAYNAYTAAVIHEGISMALGSVEYWKSFAFETTVELGIFSESGYQGWGDFGNMILAASVVGLIGCFGGAGGHYGEQRFLASKTVRDAAKIGALWQFLALPRWILSAGMVFLAFSVFREEIFSSVDPELILPLIVESTLLTTGVKGLVIVGLIAAFMSTFSSVVNAAAATIVRDIYQPLIQHQQSGDNHGLVIVSYIVTAMLVSFCLLTGYYFVESQNNNGALNAIWVWMMTGLVTCYVIPLALRWYWGRMNGWGFAIGSLVGLIPSSCILLQNFVGTDHILNSIPGAYYTFATLLVSLLGSILGSIFSTPLDDQTAIAFYAKVRPFGVWGEVAEKAKKAGVTLAEPLNVSLVVVNVVLGTLASFTLYMSPLYFLGHWFVEGAITVIVFAIACIILYFSWYLNLPEN